MGKKYTLVFDDVMLKQLKKLGSDENLRRLITKFLDKMEEFGPLAGKLLDSHLQLYEMKMKRPPIRLYYKHNVVTNELYVFEYEMKTSPEKQQRTLDTILKKASKS
jgi:mRNA-degrading endonuclease RelE of RelBE toxin-antitoxin system